eukprot:CAMPEP_0197051364 /NCGR_PEP_ID=MMETSP1384-20130603/26045_1 /TAXON_ID=29189 /ORGANISM="Ammonia sp." /LENGTH=946 /DNA_ID=CAMNT_0042483917 /DNA_START=24 /DNA_END=2864 /DNA_ORIENTATION=-
MGRKTNFLAKKRLDKYYRLAKDEGYQSRAAFKLIQINREYNFLGDCKCLLDLCAAPGGWTQVAAKYMPLSSQIIAVDLVKMKPVAGCVTIEADITTQKCRFEIKKHLHGHEVDCVLHDGAPNVSGAWTKDAYGQCELTLSALKLATQFLRVGGLFVTKVFRSADYNALLWVFQQLFDNVTSYKPMASRSSSAEIYLICQDYLAPKKIDPRLLDPKFVFREVEEKPAAVSVMRQKKGRKQKPSRDGYDQEGGLLYKTTSIMDFLNSESPEIILGEWNAFVFDVEDKEESKLLREHTATDEEILALFADLRLLAKSDFRRLLKWRVKMKRHLGVLKKSDEHKETEQKETTETAATATATGEGGEEVAQIKEYTREEIENLEDEKLEADVREMFDVAKREKRKKKRKIRQEKIKRTRVMMMGGVKPGDDWNIAEQEQATEGLFSLKKFRSAAELEYFMDGDNSVDLPNKRKKKNNRIGVIGYEEFEDSEAELEAEEARMDEMYNRYKKNHGMRTVKEERRLLKEGLGLDSDDAFSDEEDADDESVEDEDVKMANNQLNKKEQKEVGGGLLVDGEEVFKLKEDSKMMKATRWFSDNIFDEIETNENVNNELDEDEEIGDLVQVDEQKPDKSEMKTETDEQDDDEDDDFEVVTKDGRKVGAAQTETQKEEKEEEEEKEKEQKLRYKDLPEVLKLPYKVRMKMKKMNRDHRRRLQREEEKRKERDCLFEEVPEDLGEDSTDSEAIAECQALGLKMIDKKERAELIDGSYNKFAFDAFDDDCNVPDWFKDDENGNYKANLPITKEEVREHKERLRAINARPIKKVAEAKARKKLKAQRIWNKIKKQATSIADNNDLSEKTKIKQIEKLYGKLGKKKNKRVYMLSSGGRAARPANGKKPAKGATKVYVDRRLKADKLGLTHSSKRKSKTTAKRITGKQGSRRRQRNCKNLRRKR